MQTKRRWMKWVLEADAEAVELPWSRNIKRRTGQLRAKAA